jgi:hypothetical protein
VLSLLCVTWCCEGLIDDKEVIQSSLLSVRLPHSISYFLPRSGFIRSCMYSLFVPHPERGVSLCYCPVSGPQGTSGTRLPGVSRQICLLSLRQSLSVSPVVSSTVHIWHCYWSEVLNHHPTSYLLYFAPTGQVSSQCCAQH